VKAATLEELEKFFSTLEAEYDVRLPVVLPDGTRALGRPCEGPMALSGGRLPRKPTDVFFPQSGAVLTICHDGAVTPPAPPAKPLCVVGFTARDLACLHFTDRFFTEGFRDDLYFQRRDGAVIVGISGRCGPAGEFMRIAKGNCDLELISDGERWLAVPYTDNGEKIEEKLVCAGRADSLQALMRESEALPDLEAELLDQAAALVQTEQIPDCFWAEIGDLCIACTSCNLVCPTCTCFGVQDWTGPNGVERSRMWDSCQFDGFMREASGHNPLGTESLRTRRRIHHKLAADVIRWGEMGCFLCGRCDAVCPTGIGIVAVARQIVTRFGSGNT
jgi:sulfhydrogenase subunit beta (sulfur reductase)